MAPTPAQAKQHVQTQLRDEKGRFVKIKSEVTVSGPLKETPIPELEKPLIKVEITNPLKKILYWLDQIRRKQTTTFAIKLSIPLIALPVIVFAAFQFGRLSLKSPQPAPLPAQTAPPQPEIPIQISKAGTLKIAKSQNLTKYLLTLRNGEILVLEIPAEINLQKFADSQVLVTGSHNRKTNILKVAEIAEIETLKEIMLPTPTPATSSPTL